MDLRRSNSSILTSRQPKIHWVHFTISIPVPKIFRLRDSYHIGDAAARRTRTIKSLELSRLIERKRRKARDLCVDSDIALDFFFFADVKVKALRFSFTARFYLEMARNKIQNYIAFLTRYRKKLAEGVRIRVSFAYACNFVALKIVRTRSRERVSYYYYDNTS